MLRAAAVVIALLAAPLVARAAPPGADLPAAGNCVDKEIARQHGGHACWDVGTSFGKAELWTAPGLTDVRLEAVRLGFYTNGPGQRGTSFTLGDWEAIDDGRGQGLEAPRDLGDRAALHAITLRRQIDRAGWGAYVAGDVVTRWFGRTRGVTPRLGLRWGAFDRAALVVEARLNGAYLIGAGDDHRSFTDDADLSARATVAVVRRVRVEARGRYRDLTSASGRRLRDVSAVVGVELEGTPPGPRTVSPKTSDQFRALTLFAGIGVHRALIDRRPDDDVAAPALARAAAAPAAPWALMAWVDLDFCINSQRTIW